MRRIGSIFAFSFAALAVSPSASAGEISATVVPVLANVSLSTGTLETLASYRITLTNSSTSSSLNTPRLVGTTSVSAGNLGAKATFKTVAGAVCTTTNDGTSIDCTVASLAPGASAPFTVTFAAPTSGADIRLAWQAVFDSGAPPGNSNGEVGSTAIILDPIDDNKVATDVPAGFAVTIFTGSANAVPSSSDKAATKVAVPATAVATTATITEEETFLVNCTNFKTCFQSTVSIPGFVGALTPVPTYLTITLRQDSSNIKNGTRIESVLIDYVDDSSVLSPAIGDCESPTSPRNDFVPCIAKRVYYKNKRVPGWTPELNGDFEWTILNLKNGSYRFP